MPKTSFLYPGVISRRYDLPRLYRYQANTAHYPPTIGTMKRFLFSLFVLFSCVTLTAQELYTVRVGVFRDVKSSEFTSLKPLGFVYGVPGEDNTTEVFVGHFLNQEKAVNLAASLQQQGYRYAQAFLLPESPGGPAHYVQFALHSGSRPLEWAALERAGQLSVSSVDGTTKIMTGPYADAQAAAAALPTIQNLGYRDAFVKQVDPARLITIGTFETGIKKPLIPITLQDNPTPAAPPVSAPDPVPQSPTPAPTTYSASPATYTPPPAPAAAATTPLGPTPSSNNTVEAPTIDGRTKRSSTAELQRVLKEKGYYETAIDGYYGPGTTSAFSSAWEQMPELQKYKLLTRLLPQEYLGANWNETLVLMALANDIAAGTANGEREERMLEQRATLFNATQTLSPAAITRVRNWAATLWTNLDEWAIEDPLHAGIFSAFRIAYHQTQVRLEDHYRLRGMSSTDARDLATAMLQNLLGAKLDRFL